MLRICALVILSNLLATESFALTDEEQLLKSIKSVQVTVYDSVEDGCLKDFRVIWNKAELGFVRNGINAGDIAGGADALVDITLRGFKPTKAICVGMAMIEVRVLGLFEFKGTSRNLVLPLYVENSIFAPDAADGLDTFFREFVDSKVDEIALKMLKK
jgi:hypothetical protein